MPDEGLTFDEWFWRAELLAAHAAALASLAVVRGLAHAALTPTAA